MRRIVMVAVAALAGLWMTGAAQAQDRGPVVVELYTSQGCSSCPPADALLRKLAGRTDVLPLALHVDYWDYIGWKDVFGHPRHTARQKSYAQAMRQRTIYTPQMVIGGLHDVVGAHPKDVTDLIATHAAMPAAVTLNVARDAAGVTITATSNAAFVPPLDVQIVRYRPEADVEIIRGENAGKTLKYTNIVTDWQVIGQWDGRALLSLMQPVPGSEPVAVILQRPGPGAIEAAAQVR